MPHVSEFHVQPEHEAHDRLLVAALAAGDLAGTDRDHALQLTRSCATCAELHDDLVAIARATATVPPPVLARPRDFQLTAADAARLRPAGWRRALATILDAPMAASRPLGVGLATIGLAGLLIGNVPLNMGASTAAPVASSGAATSEQSRDLTAPAAAGSTVDVTAVQPAASAAASLAAITDNASGTGAGAVSPSSGEDRTSYGAAASPVGAAEGESAGGPKAADSARPGELLQSAPPATPRSDRPLNIVFAVAVVAGLGLLVVSRMRSRRPV